MFRKNYKSNEDKISSSLPDNQKNFHAGVRCIVWLKSMKILESFFIDSL